MTSIQPRFDEFHQDNPEVYKVLVRLAREVKKSGYNRYAIGAIWERMRWHFNFEAHGHGDYKFNDHYRSRYARLIMQQERDLVDFFEIRNLRSA